MITNLVKYNDEQIYKIKSVVNGISNIIFEITDSSPWLQTDKIIYKGCFILLDILSNTREYLEHNIRNKETINKLKL